MATTHDLYTVGTTAIPVSPTVTHSGMDITIQNANSSGYIYVGGEGVSATDYGYRILPNHAISVELAGHCDLYVIASAAGMIVPVLRTNLESGS